MGNVKALFVGENADQVEHVRAQCAGFNASNSRILCDPEELMAVVESGVETGGEVDSVDVVFAVDEFSGLPASEVAQILRVGFHNRPVLFISTQIGKFDRGVVMKNGFDEAFLLPIDKDQLDRTIARLIGTIATEVYSPVRLVDIEADTKLDFEIAIFLPRNNKHVALLRQGDKLNQERLDRLRAYRQTTVFVASEQMSAFYNYSARRLVELEDGAQSSTERLEKLQSSVRDFITGILSASYSQNIAQGRQATVNIRKVIDQYILLKNPNSIYQRVLDEVGQKGDAYSHAGHVSTYSALFSMAAQVGSPNEVAAAALLHDVGISMLPPEIQVLPESKMSKDELLVYRTHPKHSLDTLQSRKLLLGDDAISAVLEHHERFSGGGYPNNLDGKRVNVNSQILGLSDAFDYLTRLQANLSPLEPVQAMRRMLAEGIVNPEIARAIGHLFKSQQDEVRPKRKSA